MGRLHTMAAQLGGLPARLPRSTDAHGHGPAAEPWRKWYSTREWRDLKAAVHLRDRYICQCGCGKLIADSRERIADHKIPHRGDRARFFDPANVQTLWKPHHDGWKQRLERAGRPPGG